MLYIMRHGRTDWNDAYKLQGRTDIPLNETGREMARKAKFACDEIAFDICYCSPLSRARETAELVLAGRDIPIIEDERLLEMSFGIEEGKDHCFQHPEYAVHTLFMKPEEYKGVEGGETFEELYARTGSFLENVAKPAVAEGKNVLVVGHGAMNSCLICQIRNIPLKDFWSVGIENCKLIKLL